MASITDQNWVVWNQGKNPLVNFNFMLRVELIFDLPCKSVRAFSRELEYDYIQEGGLNDYVHMRRKPITRPFTLEVERYVGVDYIDPLPLGADLVLPVMLFVGRNHDQFIPGLVARTYVFTGCTVMKKTYGDLVGDQSGLLVETTTLGYREMLCVDIPWSEVGDDIPGSTKSNPTRNVSGEDRRGADLKVLAQDLYEKARSERDQAAGTYDAEAVEKLIGELQTAAAALSGAAKVPGGPLEAKLQAAEKASQSAQEDVEAALEKVREKEAASEKAEQAWQEKRAEWNALQAGAERASRAEAEARRAAAQAEDALQKKRAARSNAEAGKKDAEAALEKAKADAEQESGKLAALQAAAETADSAAREAGQALKTASDQKAEADAALASAEQAAAKALELEEEEAQRQAKEAETRVRELRNTAGEARDRERSAQQKAEDAQRQAETARQRVTDAQRQVDRAQERVEQARQKVEDCEKRVSQARKDVEDAETQLEEAKKAVEEPQRQAEAARQAAAEAKEEDAATENAAKSAREEAAAESRKFSAARDAASSAARAAAEARDLLDQADRQAKALQNSLTNLTDRAGKSKDAMPLCDGSLKKCEDANSQTQAQPDGELALVNAGYEDVKKYHKETVYHARLVREIRQYVDVGEKQLKAGKALQETIAAIQ